MQNTEMTMKEYFNSLKILHLAMACGSFIIALISLYLNFVENGLMKPDSLLNDTLLLIIPLFVIGDMAAAIFISRNRLKKLQEISDLEVKLARYRGLYIIILALYEGGTLIALMGHIVTANIIFLGIAAVPFILLVLNRPTSAKLTDNLQLSVEQAHKVNDPDNIISIS